MHVDILSINLLFNLWPEFMCKLIVNTHSESRSAENKVQRQASLSFSSGDINLESSIPTKIEQGYFT